MTRLSETLARRNLLSVYFTAGYPALSTVVPLCRALQSAGVDMIEIGIPFSDPVADGPVIQASDTAAIAAGMNIARLFEEISDIRRSVQVPLVLMGYINPVMRFGLKRFFDAAKRCEIDALILPDLPLDEYAQRAKPLADAAAISFVPLISPTTPSDRIAAIDSQATSFLYAVSSSAVTGGSLGLEDDRIAYLARLSEAKLNHPLLVGFGIRDHESFATVCRYAQGAIVGSAFIQKLSTLGSFNENYYTEEIKKFIELLRYGTSPARRSP
jgi:tryptophan synthase alpha chain